ncbi:MAG: succinylglutamate desuccinylase/aspartoacylase family protein [Candidatus Aenigmarchaeota archaeon]|nr:succinylglutamate desuccinylase/aspartoacylase family protein [Candidatus Aenigmarchaeota archaeon]
MFEPGQCFSLLKRYEAASRNYISFHTHVLGTVVHENTKCPVVAISIGSGRKKILITTGIHGDEKAPPEALARFIGDPGTPKLLRDFSVTLLPLMNPIGFSKNIRKNGPIDLNRHFGCRKFHRENSVIENYMNGKSFDVMISLHEDVDMKSFYMYETGSFDAGKLRDIIADDVEFINALRKKGVAINHDKTIYGILNRGGIKIVSSSKGRNLEQYLWSREIVKRVVCIETPGLIDFEKRVELHLMALRHFMKSFLY